MKAWSFSALNNYETCPKKYWHLAIERDVKEEEGEALVYGKKVHRALEMLIKKGTPLPNELSHMLPYVQKFVDFKGTKLAEQQLALDIDFQPSDWKDWDKTWVRAMLDLAIVGETHALLVDYKTGKMKDDGFTQLKLAAAIFMAHRPQIMSVEVAYLWTQHKGKTTTEVFTREQITQIWNELLPRVNGFQKAFRDTNYPARPSGLCKRYCPVTQCPHNG